MSRPKKPTRPLLAKCPQCSALPGIKCTEQGFVMESVHTSRMSLAMLQQTEPPRDPKTNVMMVVCPECGALPRRICTGPPPARDPKPYHRRRYLAAERLDNQIREAHGSRKRVDSRQLPPEERPWVKNRERPDLKPASWRDLQAIREEREQHDGEGSD